MIYNYVYVGFNSMSNLIVFLFNHFPVFFVGFDVRFEYESLVKICDEREFVTGSRVDTPQKFVYEAHAGI